MISAIRKYYGSTEIDQVISPIRTRELSVTRQQFHNRLANLDKTVLVVAGSNPNHYKLRDTNGMIDIRYENMAARKIGSLSIPRLKVNIDFNRYNASTIAAFMKSFDSAIFEMAG